MLFAAVVGDVPSFIVVSVAVVQIEARGLHCPIVESVLNELVPASHDRFEIYLQSKRIWTLSFDMAITVGHKIYVKSK